ncbi:MAG: OmpH family outer membrane protein [Dysgonamonadaceae bacterium]|jgi:outer membrane protein|nr:OmpH family outer membrane protein [Dysgonamonadaceae bacterium]
MNNSKLYIISGVFAVALIVLYILHFTTRPSTKEMTRGSFSTMLNDSSVTLPIAFVNVDSLLMNYHFAADLREVLMRKEESIRATLTERERQYQGAVNEFNRRLQNNAFLNQERAEQEAQRIQRMQHDAQQTAERLMDEFQREQMRMNIEMEDSIRVRIAEFNAIRGFEIIFSNAGTGTILHADEKYDITKEVTDFLNNRYIPALATE